MMRNTWWKRIVTAAALAALLAAPALGAGEVNVYSLRQTFLIEPILAEFTKQTGIKVNVVYAEKGLVERLKQEGKNSPADLLLTVDVARLYDAAADGLLQPVKTPALQANVPAPYRDADGQWYGLTMRARVIYASKARVRPGEVKTYDDLTAARWKGKVCTRSGLQDYNVGLMASLVAHKGEAYGEQWAKGVLANTARKPQGNDRSQAKAIKEGECDLALMNTYYMGAMLENQEQKAWAESVYIVFPEQEGRGAHVNISGAGVTASAPNKANAVKLLEFLSGDTAQQLYAERNHEYPVKPGVPWSATVSAWGRFKADALPLVEVAKGREKAVRIFNQAGFP
jgi:iron(III) transport system substrate-binding protein